jgi:Na+-driven multidrug efflux pump
VDTIFVGQFGTRAQLAALGPTTMLCDSAIYLQYFLAISTTSLLATAMAQHRPQEYTRKIISQSLGIATLFGLCMSMTVALFGKTLLCRIIVQDAAQAICLASLDLQTPQSP